LYFPYSLAHFLLDQFSQWKFLARDGSLRGNWEGEEEPRVFSFLFALGVVK
jgi:hypothetical protein